MDQVVGEGPGQCYEYSTNPSIILIAEPWLVCRAYSCTFVGVPIQFLEFKLVLLGEKRHATWIHEVLHSWI